MVFAARHLSVSISRPPAAVIAFAGDPENLPQWAAGLSAGIRKVDGTWVTESPMGTVEVAFTGPIEAGILDHDVRLPDGAVVHNPLRVLANDNGSEVVFTLYRLPGVPDADFEHDAELVRADLERLRAILEP
ncbi:polyketide cyclase [Enemella evansiae]|uniref:polyketide cyclase n=1 Tax=Enemella evansiae TaxID=2016499 RepID=UPI000B970DC9|nr:polyketide cyclase [Enemella evansiae]OYO18766.1 polyketide cyclase [Enemella evansiae]